MTHDHEMSLSVDNIVQRWRLNSSAEHAYTCEASACGALVAIASATLPTAGGPSFFPNSSAALGALARTWSVRRRWQRRRRRDGRNRNRSNNTYYPSSGVCVGSGRSLLEPAAEAACLPRLGLGERVAWRSRFGDANGSMLLGDSTRDVSVNKGGGLSGVRGLERNRAPCFALGDEALPFGLATLCRAPATETACDTPLARRRSISGADSNFGPCASIALPTSCLKDLEASARPCVPLASVRATNVPCFAKTSYFVA